MNPEFTLHHLLRNAIEREPRKIAIVDGRIEHSYLELATRADALCEALVQEKVRKGDRVGIYMEKSWEAVVTMLAASQAGAAFVNINPLLKPRQVAHIMRDSDIQVMVGDANKLAALEPTVLRAVVYRGAEPPLTGLGCPLLDIEEVLSQGGGRRFGASVVETDLATIIYTSGSTGLPKGVAISQHNLVVGAQIVSTYLENTQADRILSVLPFSFDYGLSQLTTALRVGATLVLQRSSLPGDLLRSLRKHRITGLAGVPTLWPLLIQSRTALQREPLTCLRYITNSGGRVPQAHLQELRRCLPFTKIYLMYGLTEAFRSTYLPPEDLDRGPDCIGKAIPDTEIFVLNESGQECAPGEVGELVHRGPTVALGYWGAEEETRKVFRPSPFSFPALNSGDTVVYSGDLVKRDEDGYLYFVGRRDELIKTQGYRVSPAEVEDLVASTGIVREACAFGVPDPDMGQRVVAVVSLRKGQKGSVEDIRALCLQNAPSYLVPSALVIQGELPKTPSGKIDRQAIRDAFSTR